MPIGVGWQPPEGGVSEALQQKFFEHLDPQSAVDGGCWFWNGPTNAYKPALMVDGSYVSAVRIAHAIEREAARLPGRFHKCALSPDKCINPDHCLAYATPAPKVKPDEPAAICVDCREPIKKGENWSNEAGVDRCRECEEVKMGVRAKRVHPMREPVRQLSPDSPPETMEEIASSFPLLDAMSALQFGTTPSKHVPRKLRVTDEIQTAEGPVKVEMPIGIVEANPTPAARARYMPIDMQELMAVIFRPNTMVVTFPSGTVMIAGPGGRVLGVDPEAAVQQMLYFSGERKVVG